MKLSKFSKTNVYFIQIPHETALIALTTSKYHIEKEPCFIFILNSLIGHSSDYYNFFSIINRILFKKSEKMLIKIVKSLHPQAFHNNDTFFSTIQAERAIYPTYFASRRLYSIRLYSISSTRSFQLKAGKLSFPLQFPKHAL